MTEPSAEPRQQHRELHAIRERHRPMENGRCRDCEWTSPCDTIRILDVLAEESAKVDRLLAREQEMAAAVAKAEWARAERAAKWAGTHRRLRERIGSLEADLVEMRWQVEKISRTLAGRR